MKKQNKNTKEKVNGEILRRVIFDSISSKRQIKVGYVRQAGGLYANECDTVGAHNYAVAIFATQMGYELKEELEKKFSVVLDMEKLMRIALFHDYGETRSLDTGAQAHSLYEGKTAARHCELKTAERQGLFRNVEGLRVEQTAMEDFDTYVRRSSPEAMIVGVCDALEGFEKALHAGSNIPGIFSNGLRILKANVRLYRGKADVEKKLGEIGKFLVDEVLILGAEKILDEYVGEKQTKKIIRELKGGSK